jgi:hypothetical protein
MYTMDDRENDLLVPEFINPRFHNIRHAAYHQAGHAVMAASLQRRVGPSEMLPAHDRVGGFLHPPVRGIRITTGCRSSAEIGIKVILAGPIAQREHDPASSEVWAAADYARASEVALQFSKSEEEAHLCIAFLAVQVENELRQRWEIVHRSAAHLMERAGQQGEVCPPRRRLVVLK